MRRRESGRGFSWYSERKAQLLGIQKWNPRLLLVMEREVEWFGRERGFDGIQMVNCVWKCITNDAV